MKMECEWKKPDDTSGLFAGDLVYCYVEGAPPFISPTVGIFNGLEVVCNAGRVHWWLSGVLPPPKVPRGA